MNKITLESGREIEFEKPNWTKRTEIWDESIRKLSDKIPLTLATCNKILRYCKVCTERDLDEDKFTVMEVYEIGGLLLTEVWSTELIKKK
jgi:hypothetical protein